ncbi:ABC transporter G family member 7 [Camellia lanceoleosa]|uniref:ABC transporter G family member 7 n=1 Tax=Camellia lanceoleosa TaxID=1840588 RepID=A0ACC0IIR9_9ERIC|nr:ABC transporter G family member 7 [Camellia lanceoleosa]
MGLLQVAAINMAMAFLTKTGGVFPKERAIVDRVCAKGSHALGPYLLSKVLAEIPVGAAFPLLFGTILYPMARLRPTLSRFSIFLKWDISEVVSRSRGLKLSDPNNFEVVTGQLVIEEHELTILERGCVQVVGAVGLVADEGEDFRGGVCTMNANVDVVGIEYSTEIGGNILTDPRTPGSKMHNGLHGGQVGEDYAGSCQQSMPKCSIPIGQNGCNHVGPFDAEVTMEDSVKIEIITGLRNEVAHLK